MYYFIYKTTNKINGKYYIGRHSTNKLDDGYFGSGLWVSRSNKKNLEREILLFCDSFEELLEKEKEYIKQNIDNAQCMNFNNSSVGFGSGELNPANRPEEREKRRARMKTNNPMKGKTHSEDAKEKIRQSSIILNQKRKDEGWEFPLEARLKISESRKGKKASEATKEKLSQLRKGKKPQESCTMKGKTHSEDAKEKIRQKALNRQKIECEHCHRLFSPNTYKRWHGDNCKEK